MGKCFSLTKSNYYSEWERKRCYCGWNGNKEKNIWLAHGYFLHMILNSFNIWIFRDLKSVCIETLVNVKLLLYKIRFTHLEKCPESVDETHINRVKVTERSTYLRAWWSRIPLLTKNNIVRQIWGYLHFLQ